VIHRGAPAKLGDRTPYSTGPAPGRECAAAPATQPHRAAHTASRWHALSGLTVNLICDEQAAADSQVGLMMRRARHLLATAPQYCCLCARACMRRPTWGQGGGYESVDAGAGSKAKAAAKDKRDRKTTKKKQKKKGASAGKGSGKKKRKPRGAPRALAAFMMPV
jgi:hypothetical protein